MVSVGIQHVFLKSFMLVTRLEAKEKGEVY